MELHTDSPHGSKPQLPGLAARMKPISILLCALALAAVAAAGSLLVISAPAHAGAPLAPPARTSTTAPAPSAGNATRTGLSLATGIPYAPPGRPLDAEALDAIRAAALERAERERRFTLFERQRTEGEWLRVLADEVAASLGLDATSGQLIAKILLEERDGQAALWEEARGIKNKRASRTRLEEGTRTIQATRRAALEATFGAELAKAIHDLLEAGGPGVDGEPGALARAGH